MNEKIIWDYFKGKGFTDAGTAGLMGNLYAESGLNPKNLQNSFEKNQALMMIHIQKPQITAHIITSLKTVRDMDLPSGPIGVENKIYIITLKLQINQLGIYRCSLIFYIVSYPVDTNLY